MYKCIAMNDGENGDIGYVYFSNTNNSDGGILKDKLVFKQLNGLNIEGVVGNEINVSVDPNKDEIYILR